MLWGGGVAVSLQSLSPSLKSNSIEKMNKSKRLQLALIFLLIFNSPASAKELIKMKSISLIESSNNFSAFNSRTSARGLYQITPICLKEYNNFHKVKYSEEDLFNAEINTTIASWYINERIPQMLRHYKKPITTRNILISYNAGISYVAKNKKLPEETERYIKRYEKIN